MKYTYLVLLLILSTSLGAQNLWPGDINNNGIANRNDFLYLGLSIGQSDTSRTNASINWQPQTSPNWPSTIPGLPNVSAAFADTDGDGFVDSLDAQAIIQNYGLTHSTPILESPSPINAAAPRLFFSNTPISAAAGDTVNMLLQLGSAANPVTNIHGFAFQLRIDSTLIVPGSFQLNFDSTWIPGPLLSYSRNIGGGTIDGALTRINQMAVSGGGGVASIAFIIEDDLFGTPSTVVEIDSLILLDATGQKLDANPQNAAINFDLSSLARQPAPASRLYPNPNTGRFWLERATNRPTSLRLFDGLGRCRWEAYSTQSVQEIQLPELAAGLYWLEVEGQWHALSLQP